MRMLGTYADTRYQRSGSMKQVLNCRNELNSISFRDGRTRCSLLRCLWWRLLSDHLDRLRLFRYRDLIKLDGYLDTSATD